MSPLSEHSTTGDSPMATMAALASTRHSVFSRGGMKCQLRYELFDPDGYA